MGVGAKRGHKTMATWQGGRLCSSHHPARPPAALSLPVADGSPAKQSPDPRKAVQAGPATNGPGTDPARRPAWDGLRTEPQRATEREARPIPGGERGGRDGAAPPSLPRCQQPFPVLDSCPFLFLPSSAADASHPSLRTSLPRSCWDALKYNAPLPGAARLPGELRLLQEIKTRPCPPCPQVVLWGSSAL